jgi:serine phosphatase RsbU (regulator of sigma subunit)
VTMLQEATPDRLCALIDALHRASRKLSRTSSLKDLGAHFARLTKEVFTTLDVHLFLRPEGIDRWQPVVSGTTEGVDRILLREPDEATAECTVREVPEGIVVSQQLINGTGMRCVCLYTANLAEKPACDTAAIRLLAYFFDSAYQDLLTRKKGKDLVFSLNHRLLQLNSLVDTGIEVAKLAHELSPARLALERAAVLTNASVGRVRVMHGAELTEEMVFPEGAAVTEGPTAERRIETDFTYGRETYRFELFDKESRDGVIQFEATDLLLLKALARQVHASLENRYLHNQALEKLKLDQDIAVAASIQQRILPTALPAIEGYDIAGINIPSKLVGGDYYDCIPLPDGTYAFVIADVSGKGVPAALLVSSLHAYLSAYLESPNHASTDDKFITAFLGILDPKTGELESLNAGHPPVFQIHPDGTFGELNLGGVPFGMLDMDFPYQSEKVTLGRGDRLLMYTDGVTEASNEQDQLYDDHASLKDFVAAHKPDTAAAFIDRLIADIRLFTGSAPQNDDITALYLVRR